MLLRAALATLQVVAGGVAQGIPLGRQERRNRMRHLHRAKLLPCGREVHIMPPLQIARLVRLAAHRGDSAVQVKHSHIRLATKQLIGCRVVVVDTLVESCATAPTREALCCHTAHRRDGCSADPQELATSREGLGGLLVYDTEVSGVGGGLRDVLGWPTAVTNAKAARTYIHTCQHGARTIIKRVKSQKNCSQRIADKWADKLADKWADK